MANEENLEATPADNSKKNGGITSESRRKKTTKKVAIVPLVLIMVFGVAIFFMLKEFDENRALINLYLIAVISIFVGFCCWFFIGSIEGNEFEVFGFKIKTITGSFFIFLFVFVIGVRFFNPDYLEPIIVFDERNIQGLADNKGIDFKLKIITDKKANISNLDNYSYLSSYTSTVTTSQSYNKPKKLDIALQFPDTISKAASKVVVYIDNNTYQKLINPNSTTTNLSQIPNWAEFGKKDGYHIFQHSFQPNISISLTLYK